MSTGSIVSLVSCRNRERKPHHGAGKTDRDPCCAFSIFLVCFFFFVLFLSQARTTEPPLPRCVRLMLHTKRQTRCETRHSRVRKRSHALPLAKHTHLHTHAQIPPLSPIQQARRRTGQHSKPPHPPPSRNPVKNHSINS